MGGSTELPKRWLYHLTGYNIPSTFVDLRVYRHHAYWNPWQYGTDALPDLYYPHLFSTIGFDDNHEIFHLPPDEIIQRDQLLIMLVDRVIGSAGEVFVDKMFRMENTLVVGQNTRGNLLSFGDGGMRLPSGINVRISSFFTVHPDGHFVEGLGYAPDIWVEGDVLVAVLGMLGVHVVQNY